MYSAYLGLIPGDDSSGGHEKKLGITKAGNNHLRRLLVEATTRLYTRKSRI
ncbi:MAG: transposase [Catenibacterium sp.]